MDVIVTLRNNSIYTVENFEGDLADVLYFMNCNPFVRIGSHIFATDTIECVNTYSKED